MIILHNDFKKIYFWLNPSFENDFAINEIDGLSMAKKSDICAIFYEFKFIFLEIFSGNWRKFLFTK